MLHVLHLWVLCRNVLALCDELVYILIRSKLFPVMYLLLLKKACPHMGQCIYFTVAQYKVTTDSILVRRAVRNLVFSFELLHCCRNIVTSFKKSAKLHCTPKQLHSHKLEHYRVNCHSFHMMKTGNKKGQSIYSQRFDYPVKNVNAALFMQGN